jgi:type IV pilus assembly protein PilM
MGFFSSVFGRKESESVLGIDIGSSSIKVVQLKREGGMAVLETYGELALGPYARTEIGRSTSLPPDQLAKALTDLLKECKAGANTCGLAIPFASSLISVIEIPEVPKKEIDSIVPIEARKYIPVPISEVSLDWSVIPRF